MQENAHNMQDGLASILIGWVLIGLSLLGNITHNSLGYVFANFPYEDVEFLLKQLLHMAQIVGVTAGVYFSYKGYKKSHPPKK